MRSAAKHIFLLRLVSTLTNTHLIRLCIGEPLRRATAAKALACFPMQAKLVLAYGQTEAPMDVMHHEVYPGDLAYESIPIGRRPFPGYSAILVDQYLQPVIPGRPGEILISGKHIFYSE